MSAFAVSTMLLCAVRAWTNTFEINEQPRSQLATKKSTYLMSWKERIVARHVSQFTNRIVSAHSVHSQFEWFATVAGYDG